MESLEHTPALLFDSDADIDVEDPVYLVNISSDTAAAADTFDTFDHRASDDDKSDLDDLEPLECQLRQSRRGRGTCLERLDDWRAVTGFYTTCTELQNYNRIRIRHRSPYCLSKPCLRSPSTHPILPLSLRNRHLRCSRIHQTSDLRPTARI